MVLSFTEWGKPSVISALLTTLKKCGEDPFSGHEQKTAASLIKVLNFYFLFPRESLRNL